MTIMARTIATTTITTSRSSLWTVQRTGKVKPAVTRLLQPQPQPQQFRHHHHHHSHFARVQYLYQTQINNNHNNNNTHNKSHPHLAIATRGFARSSGSTNPPDVEKAVTFIITVGYERPIAQGIANALKESGLSGDALLSTARQLAGRWEVGEDEGLEALAASVKMNLSKTEGKQNVTFYVVPPNSWNSAEGEEEQESNDKDDSAVVDRDTMMSRAFAVEALEGTSLTDVAQFGDGQGASTLGEYIECACAGIMACSTCHVVVDEEWFDKVGPPCEAELDMLDLAYSPRDTSRLGCQIVLGPELEGLVVKIPKGSNNLMDFVPFQD